MCNNDVIITGALPADVRCFPRVVCEGDVIERVYTPEQCCIEDPRGVAYDYSGQIEKCHACEGTPHTILSYCSHFPVGLCIMLGEV